MQASVAPAQRRQPPICPVCRVSMVAETTTDGEASYRCVFCNALLTLTSVRPRPQ